MASAKDERPSGHFVEPSTSDQNGGHVPSCFCDDEWSPLKEVIVGRADHSHFPSEPREHLATTMPAGHLDQFRPGNPFPAQVVQEAISELDSLAALLEGRGITVHRPRVVDWGSVGGYTGAMPRDALLVVGNTIIESCYAWRCRRDEVKLAYGDILNRLQASGQYQVVRAPTPDPQLDIYDTGTAAPGKHQWSINDARPAFDAADFMRCGPFLVGQRSHVTNASGVEYLQRLVARDGWRVLLPEIDCPAAMHIDATFVPLRKGLAIYNSLWTSEEALHRTPELRDWKLVPISRERRKRDGPPLYMTSPEIRMNILSLDERTVLVEKDDEDMATLFQDLGLEVIRLPFKNVQSMGGSFHCATVDLKREPST